MGSHFPGPSCKPLTTVVDCIPETMAQNGFLSRILSQGPEKLANLLPLKNRATSVQGDSSGGEMLCLERTGTQVWRPSIHTESEAWWCTPVIAEPGRRIPKVCWPASLAELASFGFRDPVSKNRVSD